MNKMKKWVKYNGYLRKGDWHVHTNYTDGKNTIFQYCKQAINNNLEFIAFTEHVRKTLDYNFSDFMAEIYSAKDKFDIEVAGGCEAKVFDLDGNIAVNEDILKECEIVIGSFHRFPYSFSEYLAALKNLIQNKDVDIWGHPTLFLKKRGLNIPSNEVEEILELCRKNDVLIERNLKYNLPEKGFLDIVRKLKIPYVYGSDAHCIGQLISLRGKHRA